MSEFVIPKHIDIEDSLGKVRFDIEKAKTVLYDVMAYFDSIDVIRHTINPQALLNIACDAEHITTFLNILDDELCRAEDTVKALENAGRYAEV